MKTDNALRAALAKQQGELPYGFELHVMRKIRHEVERRENRRDKLGLVTVALVSVSLLAGLCVLLKNLLHIDVLHLFYAIRFPAWHPATGIRGIELLTLCSMCLPILLIMLVLLSLDSLFRRLMRKRHMR